MVLYIQYCFGWIHIFFFYNANFCQNVLFFKVSLFLLNISWDLNAESIEKEIQSVTIWTGFICFQFISDVEL